MHSVVKHSTSSSKFGFEVHECAVRHNLIISEEAGPALDTAKSPP